MCDQQPHATLRPARCRIIHPAVAAVMVEMVTARTDEALTDQFGISYNTWRKIERSQPIRASVADRVERSIIQQGFVAASARG
jgi:hypothetical protein